MQDLHFAPNNDQIKWKPDTHEIPLSIDEQCKKSMEMKSHRAAFMDCGMNADWII